MKNISSYCRLLVTFFFLLCEANLSQLLSASSQFPDYQELCSYLKKPKIKLDGIEFDLTPIHEDMVKIEYAYHRKDDKKNFCLIRFTPILEVEEGYKLGETVKVTQELGDKGKTECLFVSSFDPNEGQKGKQQPLNPLSPLGYSSTIYLCPDGCSTKVSCISRLTNSFPRLVLTLEKRLGPISQSKVLSRWCDFDTASGSSSQKNSKLHLVGRLNSMKEELAKFERELEDFKKTYFSFKDVCASQSFLGDHFRATTELVKAVAYEGGLSCSEQNAFDYCFNNKTSAEEIVSPISKQGKVHRIVVNIHTTKHPCRTCGLSILAELMFPSGLFEYLLKLPQAKEGKILALISYREQYDDLPNSAKIDWKEVLSEGDLVELPKIGIVPFKASTEFRAETYP